MACEHVELDILMRRVAGELEALADIAHRLQDATSEFPPSVLGAHAETLQEIDRLHQSLAGLAQFLGSLSAMVPGLHTVDATKAAEGLALSRLQSGLIGVPVGTGPHHDCGDLDLFDPSQAAA